MQILSDWIKENTFTTGTGLTITLGGAVSGFIPFSSASKTVNNAVFYYLIKDGNNLEHGVGTWKTGNAFDRTTVKAKFENGTYSENPGTRLNLTGAAQVMVLASSAAFDDMINNVAMGKTITTAGVTGAQTINKNAGAVNFAAAASSLVVTNSLVTTSSVIIATVATNDATLKSVAVVAAAGSFTLHANAAATAETRVNFIVIN